jgi:hypothetical protein
MIIFRKSVFQKNNTHKFNYYLIVRLDSLIKEILPIIMVLNIMVLVIMVLIIMVLIIMVLIIMEILNKVMMEMLN